MSAQLHLVYATDANYLFPTEVSARSALVKASRPADLVIHILDCGIPDDQWVSFSGRMPQAIRHQIDLSLFRDFREWHGSLAAYARLCIPELLNGVKRCIYADADTLFTDDLFCLEMLNDPEIALWGHHDTAVTSQPRWFEEQGLVFRRERYVCSGFLLMNLCWMREHHATEWCLQFLGEHPMAPFPDQDALNCLCGDAIVLLPHRWGVYSGAAFRPDARPGCIHYAGELPWNLKWRWFMGYSDAAALWFVAAKALLGMSRRDAGGISGLRWYAGRLYNRLIRMAVTVLGILPVMRRRFPNLRTRFAGYAHRGMFKPSFWTDAGLGGARQ